jgi:DNA-binding NarL/FixJ family response regulator
MATDITVPITRMDQRADGALVTGNESDAADDAAARVRLGIVLGGRHPVTLCGLAQVFENERDYTILAVCTDSDATLEAVRRHQPEIVILDLDRSATFRVLRRIHRHAPAARVIVLTSASDHDEMADAVRVGARAVIRKELPPEAFVAGVRRAHSSESIDGTMPDGLAAQFSKVMTSTRRTARQLTPRESEIARLAVLGVSTRDIADRLAVKQGTVKIHLHSIYDKLSVGGRLGLVLFARRHGLA